MRALVALLSAAVLLVTSACSRDDDGAHPYGVQGAAIGETQSVLDASLAQADGPHAKPEDIRCGLYGALAHPLEANAIGGCRDVTSLAVQPAAAPTPDRLSGTVCIGPMRDQSQVRGAYVYSPKDRMAGTTVSYGAAFPFGLPETNQNDAGLSIATTSVDAFSADGAQLDPSALGDPNAFNGKGYMLLGLEISGLAANAALLYASVSLVGTHAGLWTTK